MLEEFKNIGMCITVDSAYMGNIIGQISREVWKINFVGTCHSDRTGAEVKETKNKMTVGTYESIIYQHTSKALVYTMWANNTIVKTLSNFHLPEVLAIGAGMLRRGKHDGVWDAHKTEVPCPA